MHASRNRGVAFFIEFDLTLLLEQEIAETTRRKIIT
jgi:hypothetical protein